MKKKITLTIVFIPALILAYFFCLNTFQPRVNPIHADDIESIMLVAGSDQSVYNCSPEQIRTFTEAFNQATHDHNDAGTTPPARVDMLFKDGTRKIVWGYNQGFATLKAANGLQQNIRGKALQDWFTKAMSGGTPKTTAPSSTNSSSQSVSSRPGAAPEFANDSINQYMTYDLPSSLVDGSYNRELGYLGGNLFCLKDTGSSVAKEASESTPRGWNSYCGAEMYYKLNCQFENGQLTGVSLPWNHSIDLTKAKPADKCLVPAVIVQIASMCIPHRNANRRSPVRTL